MEHRRGQTLKDAAFLRKFTETEVIDIMRQLARIISYLHHIKRVMHRDIKPENIIIDEHNIVSLIDFGFADYITENMTERLGSPAFCSPEVVIGNPYNELADVWSLGVVCYWLIAGRLPFFGDTVEDVFREIYTKDPPTPPHASRECACFLKEILCKDPNCRLSIRGVMNHVWLVSGSLTETEKNGKISGSLGVIKHLRIRGHRKSLVVRPRVTTSLAFQPNLLSYKM